MAQRFAYGDDMVHHHACPVAAVDESLLADEALTVAEQYDEIGRERFDGDKGTVTADTAKEMWNEAIDKVEAQLQVERDSDHADYLRRAIDQAKEVRKEAF